MFVAMKAKHVPGRLAEKMKLFHRHQPDDLPYLLQGSLGAFANDGAAVLNLRFYSPLIGIERVQAFAES